MKKVLILSWLIGHSLLLHAQITPDDKNWKEFVSIALASSSPGEQAPVVRKWQQPIRYKIYGTSNNADNDKKIGKYVQQLFQKLAPLTGLDISNAKDDSQVNLCLLIGRSTEVSDMTLPQAAQSFSIESEDSHCYYTSAENGYTQMLTYINPDDTTLLKHKKTDNSRMDELVEHLNDTGTQEIIRGSSGSVISVNQSNGQPKMVIAYHQPNASKADIQQNRLQKLWCEMRLMLMKSMGFNGVTDDSSSLFTNRLSQRLASQKIIPSDARIIKALYNPAVKPGMTEQQVYSVAGNLFAK